MKLTREGKRFLLATLLITVAAVNTGNNLIFLILSLMLSLILLSFMLLKINLLGLSIEVSLNGPVYAGDTAYALVTVLNRKKISAYSINLHADDAVSDVALSVIPQGGVVIKEIGIIFKRRGIYEYKNFFVQSGYPFILFQKKTAIKIYGNILVYPRLRDIDGIITDIEGYQEYGEAPLRGVGDEIYAIRDFRYGDDRRNIHWKASAKQSRLLVREYAGYESRKISIIVDNRLPLDERNFERVMSVAASLAKYFIDHDYHVRLLSCGKIIPFGEGDQHLFEILDTLALMKEEVCVSVAFPDHEGCNVVILKSGAASMKDLAESCDMVIYADTL